MMTQKNCCLRYFGFKTQMWAKQRFTADELKLSLEAGPGVEWGGRRTASQMLNADSWCLF